MSAPRPGAAPLESAQLLSPASRPYQPPAEGDAVVDGGVAWTWEAYAFVTIAHYRVRAVDDFAAQAVLLCKRACTASTRRRSSLVYLPGHFF